MMEDDAVKFIYPMCSSSLSLSLTQKPFPHFLPIFKFKKWTQ